MFYKICFIILIFLFFINFFKIKLLVKLNFCEVELILILKLGFRCLYDNYFLNILMIFFKLNNDLVLYDFMS